MSKQTPGVFVLKNVRLRYPKFDTPEQFNGEGEFAYSGSFILSPDHPQAQQIRDEITAVAKAEWPTDYASVVKAGFAKDLHCLHDGDNKAASDGYAGNLYVSVRNSGKQGKMPTLKPTLLDKDRSELPDQRKLYDGCLVNVKLDLWAQNNAFGKRINARVTGVQFAGDAPEFAAGGGSRAKAEDFDDISESATADDFV